jgi:hypothetical protein
MKRAAPNTTLDRLWRRLDAAGHDVCSIVGSLPWPLGDGALNRTLVAASPEEISIVRTQR